MKEITRKYYACEICRQLYDCKEEALECESKPISQDKGIKVGDKVRITQGEGKGQVAIVTDIYVTDKEWGHYARERYWHTIKLCAKLSNGCSRILTFDSYQCLKEV